MRIAMIAMLILCLLFGADMTVQAQDSVETLFQQFSPCVVNVTFNIRQQRGIQKRNGTGLLVSAEGLIMLSSDNFPGTVAFDDFQDFSIKADERGTKTWKGQYLGIAPGTGVAFVQAKLEEGEVTPFIDFENAAAPRIGSEVLSIGLLSVSGGYLRFLKVGRISAQSNTETDPFYIGYDLSQDLGSPVFSMEGKIIGILGDTDELAKILPPAKLLSGIQSPPDPEARPALPWLGVTDMQPLTKALAGHWGIDQTDGVIVGNVLKGHPAGKGGLRNSDVILALNGQALESGMNSVLQTFQIMLRSLAPGETVTFKVWRDGKIIDVQVTLGERPTEAVNARKWKIDAGSFNFTVRDMVFRDRWDRYLDEESEGVVVSFIQTGWARDGGIGRWDIIQQVNGVAVAGIENFQQLMERVIREREKEVVFQVIRGQLNESFVARIECDWGS